LIMRHDKQSFAQDAIQAAQVGKLIGDYVRMLYFSAYARALEISVRQIKERVDPFTGSFISYIPTTLTLLCFGLKIEAQFQAGEQRQAIELQQLGVQRINQALEFTTGDAQNLRQQYIEERKGWELYYDTLLALERGIQNGDPFAEHLRRRARKLTSAMAIAAGVPRASAD
jgi:antirestriction protein